MVDAIEKERERGGINNTMVLMFMDNSSVKTAVLKVNSSSRGLFNQIVRIKRLESKHGCMLHVMHFSGTRIIAQVIDIVSRGELKKGALQGNPISNFTPLNLNAIEQLPDLEIWLKK